MNTKYSCQEVTFEKIKQLILLIEALLNYGGLGFVLKIESTGIIHVQTNTIVKKIVWYAQRRQL